MQQKALALDEQPDSAELEATLALEAAAFRARTDRRDNASGARRYRSGRAARVGRAYLDALHQLFRPSAEAEKARSVTDADA